MEPISHTIEDGLEQYAFPSRLHDTQLHYLDREPGQPWRIDPVDLPDSLSVADAEQYVAEIQALVAFAADI